ncbi:MAG: RNA polymerase factor sigma-54 [Gammaproteobacteria bacterium]|nr:RNA polymerase factor sigma-54 [Gammaproteobacteria bacterium]
MKQTLQLKLGQHLTMTPQLQQAIRLLQLSGIELQQEIQQALDSNPMLESEEEGSNSSEPGNQNESKEPEQNESSESIDTDTSLQQSDIPADLPVDSNWDDVYESSASYTQSQDQERDYEVQGQTSQSLNEHLIWQLEMSTLSRTDEAIAIAIIDSIDDDGYLPVSIEEIHQGLSKEIEDLELDEVEAVLHRVQNFDPPGIAARDLRESMLLQIKQYDPETPWLAEATLLVKDYFDLLANREYPQLIRKIKLSEADLQRVVSLIQTLNPRPGSIISNSQPEYIVPDVFVKKINGAWKVDLNPEVMPKLRVNTLYSNMIQRANNSSDNTYLKNQLQEARWLMKSLRSRSETLLKVATCIVERQQAFLDHGEEKMTPMVMFDIAETVEMHESTISRVTTKKYMHTPKGIYELKYFFSSHVSTSGGGACSSTAIRAMLKKLVASENPTKPLSDSKLAKLLENKGINVARRTVAKYREAMYIPPSNERKRLI